jgi:hypothetical protein
MKIFFEKDNIKKIQRKGEQKFTLKKSSAWKMEAIFSS